MPFLKSWSSFFSGDGENTQQICAMAPVKRQVLSRYCEWSGRPLCIGNILTKNRIKQINEP